MGTPRFRLIRPYHGPHSIIRIHNYLLNGFLDVHYTNRSVSPEFSCEAHRLQLTGWTYNCAVCDCKMTFCIWYNEIKSTKLKKCLSAEQILETNKYVLYLRMYIFIYTPFFHNGETWQCVIRKHINSVCVGVSLTEKIIFTTLIGRDVSDVVNRLT